MRRNPFLIRHLAAAAALSGLVWAGTASAVTCFIIFDRNDNDVYRDANPPVDLSDLGAQQRAALRARGMHLLMAEFDQCFSTGYIATTTGSATASVDEIVMLLRPAIDPSVGQPGRAAARARSNSDSASNYATSPASVRDSAKAN